MEKDKSQSRKLHNLCHNTSFRDIDKAIRRAEAVQGTGVQKVEPVVVFAKRRVRVAKEQNICLIFPRAALGLVKAELHFLGRTVRAVKAFAGKFLYEKRWELRAPIAVAAQAQKTLFRERRLGPLGLFGAIPQMDDDLCVRLRQDGALQCAVITVCI